MFVIVVGLNHRTVSLDVLERMTVSEERLPKALDDLGSREHIAEVVLLSTCHRTEAYVLTDRFHGAVQDVRNFLSELAFIPPEEFSDHLYTYHDDAAVAHLFGVAAGLDSVVLGESEILGQVRSSWEQARAHGSAGTVLSDLFRHALEVGKRARSETGIARSTTSLSHAAVAMAAERLGGLAGRTILVLGAGDVGESMAVALAGSGVDGILVANRTWSKAVELAARVGGRALTLDAVPDTLASVDLLLTSTGAPSLVLERADLEAATSTRGEQPLLVVDVAVPRDVDPGVATLPGVTLLDMDDLRAFVDVGIGERRKEVARVQSIIRRSGALPGPQHGAPGRADDRRTPRTRRGAPGGRDRAIPGAARVARPRPARGRRGRHARRAGEAAPRADRPPEGGGRHPRRPAPERGTARAVRSVGTE